MKHGLPLLSLNLLILTLFTSTAVAYEPRLEWRLPEPRDTAAVETAGERADTLFLFAASGPGAWGQPGTTDRGYSFDDLSGATAAPAEAGWASIDLAAQDGLWWHIESTALCAGHAVDMSGAAPFGGGDNLFALWCGRANVCGWEIPDGYGNDWDQWIELDLGDWTTSAGLQFQFRADYEGNDCDWLEVMLDVDGEYETLASWMDDGPTPLATADIAVNATDYPGQQLGNLVIRFVSDGGWSSEDGLFASDMGPVWLDNVILTADGAEIGRADFEDNIQPAWMTFTEPETAGNFGALYCNLFTEDICVINNTYAWVFWDWNYIDPNYCLPVIHYGPPYMKNALQSPVLELGHALGDADGEPLDVNWDNTFALDYWRYWDSPLDALIMTNWAVAVQTAETPCLSAFNDDHTVFYPPESWGWKRVFHDLNEPLMTMAAGETVTGIAVQLHVLDMCDIWCNLYGDGTGHTMAPYFDNINIMSISGSPVTWTVDGRYRLQDNFPEPGTNLVRIDGAANIADPPAHVIADSMTVAVEMEAHGGVDTHFNAASGEERPNLYLYFRVICGPHADVLDPAMGDPDDGDGLYCPYDGTEVWFGEEWNRVVADYTAPHGAVVSAACDLSDAYFAPGDVIEYFLLAEAVDGTTSTQPTWALSADPDLRNYHRVSCLPTEGSSALLVEDADVDPYWQEAYRYTGFFNWDVYAVQSPAYGLDNGLAGRASAADIEQYATIIWDSGNLSCHTIETQEMGSIVPDDALLTAWLNEQEHDAGLWVMGNEIANDLGIGSSFLNSVLGAELISEHLFYDDYTEVLSPQVYATHPWLQYIGSAPYFSLDGGCPTLENYALITPVGALVETTHDWAIPAADAVAGVFNRDPDDDGLVTSATGHSNRVVFNPFTYAQVLDDGFAVPYSRDYARLMVRHVLQHLLGNTNFWDTDVDDTPAVTALRGNYPNPFNPTTTISFSLAEAGPVELKVYDIAGRLVTELVNGRLKEGPHDIAWSGRDDAGRAVASGVYFYRLTAGEYTATEKMTLLK